MKKAFFDIGTNRFQGYDLLAAQFGITDDWSKIFIEPNPDFKNDEQLMERIRSIKNSKLISAALCCDCNNNHTIMAIENGYNMDQGANIFRQDWLDQGRPSVQVPVVTFDEVCKDYLHYDWYMKFDCEGCEWSCLYDIVSKYHSNIKHLVVEFHGAPWNLPDRFPPNIEQKVRGIIEEHNITLQAWH